MRLSEFLTELKKVNAKWILFYGRIRTVPDTFDSTMQCPITSLFLGQNVTPSYAFAIGRRLGMSSTLMNAIVATADGYVTETRYRWLRKKLLEATGLSNVN